MFAEVTLVDHLPKGLFVHASSSPVFESSIRSNRVRKGIAQIEAAAAAMADVEHPFEFFCSAPVS